MSIYYYHNNNWYYYYSGYWHCCDWNLLEVLKCAAIRRIFFPLKSSFKLAHRFTKCGIIWRKTPDFVCTFKWLKLTLEWDRVSTFFPSPIIHWHSSIHAQATYMLASPALNDRQGRIQKNNRTVTWQQRCWTWDRWGSASDFPSPSRAVQCKQL